VASDTIILFGAGATKACGGPLTNEILPQAFEPTVCTEIEREYYIDLLDRFLIENFHLPQQQADRTEADYPALPLLLSLVDTAIDRNQPMGPNWTVDLLRQVRRALQYMVFALLERRQIMSAALTKIVVSATEDESFSAVYLPSSKSPPRTGTRLPCRHGTAGPSSRQVLANNSRQPRTRFKLRLGPGQGALLSHSKRAQMMGVSSAKATTRTPIAFSD
jgi:hypothetical protein